MPHDTGRRDRVHRDCNRRRLGERKASAQAPQQFGLEELVQGYPVLLPAITRLQDLRQLRRIEVPALLQDPGRAGEEGRQRGSALALRLADAWRRNGLDRAVEHVTPPRQPVDLLAELQRPVARQAGPALGSVVVALHAAQMGQVIGIHVVGHNVEKGLDQLTLFAVLGVQLLAQFLARRIAGKADTLEGVMQADRAGRALDAVRAPVQHPGLSQACLALGRRHAERPVGEQPPVNEVQPESTVCRGFGRVAQGLPLRGHGRLARHGLTQQHDVGGHHRGDRRRAHDHDQSHAPRGPGGAPATAAQGTR